MNDEWIIAGPEAHPRLKRPQANHRQLWLREAAET